MICTEAISRYLDLRSSNKTPGKSGSNKITIGKFHSKYSKKKVGKNKLEI